jgi:hypothetical protein
MHTASICKQTGIYKPTYMECQKSHIGQMGRSLNIRCKEHIRSIRSNRKDPCYATHILRNSRRYRKMEEIMDKIPYARKGRIMNIKENLYIYIYKQRNKVIDEQRSHDNHKNALFDKAMTGIATLTSFIPYYVRTHQPQASNTYCIHYHQHRQHPNTVSIFTIFYQNPLKLNKSNESVISS